MPKNDLSHTACPSRAGELAGVERFGPIVQRRPSELICYQNNPRKHPDKQIDALVHSIEEFGFTLPVLITSGNVIIAGEARVVAAKRLGMAEVPAIVALNWKDAKVQAYRLLDNRLSELAEWDDDRVTSEVSKLYELDEISLDIIELIDIRSEQAPAKIKTTKARDAWDAQPALTSEPVSSPGNLWQLGRHKILCGSSLDSGAWGVLLDGQAAGLCFSDLSALGQLNSPTDFHRANPDLLHDDGQCDVANVIESTIRVISPHLKDGALLELCGEWRELPAIMALTERWGLSLLDVCVWNRTRPGRRAALYHRQHSIIAIIKKGEATLRGKRGRKRSDVWEYPAVGGVKTTAPIDSLMPVAMVMHAIEDVTQGGDIVLSAFAGTGTTILAAEKCNRRAFAVESDPVRVDMAIQRWQSLTGLSAVLLETGQAYDELCLQSHAELRRRAR